MPRLDASLRIAVPFWYQYLKKAIIHTFGVRVDLSGLGVTVTTKLEDNQTHQVCNCASRILPRMRATVHVYRPAISQASFGHRQQLTHESGQAACLKVAVFVHCKLWASLLVVLTLQAARTGRKLRTNVGT